MAGSHQPEALLDKLDSQQTNRLQKLIALERLSEDCENGFSSSKLELMLKKVTSIKGTTYAIQLLDCCLPSEDVSLATIDRAVYFMANPHTAPTLRRALLSWLLAGALHFFGPEARRHLHSHYGVIFCQIGWSHMVNLTCTLLYQLTEHRDVQQHRVDMLVTRSAASDSGPRWALIRARPARRSAPPAKTAVQATDSDPEPAGPPAKRVTRSRTAVPTAGQTPSGPAPSTSTTTTITTSTADSTATPGPSTSKRRPRAEPPSDDEPTRIGDVEPDSPDDREDKMSMSSASSSDENDSDDAVSQSSDSSDDRDGLDLDLDGPEEDGDDQSQTTEEKKYRQLRPDMVLSYGGPDSQTRWEKPRSQLMTNLNRWRLRREGVGAAAAGGTGGAGSAAGAGGDFWELANKVSRWTPALPVLPESVAAPGGGAPDPDQGRRDLASLGSLKEVVAEGAVGFRSANNLTALALSSHRRAVLLLSDTREIDTAKMSLDLLVTLRQMLVYDPRRYPVLRRRQLIRQVQLCHRVGLPLSAGRHLMRTLLEGARPEHSALWLPALDLVPFYGWRPQAVLLAALLRPLETLVAAADRHARLHVVHVLTEFVVQLARHDLPLVVRRAFPYSSQTCRDEIASTNDPAVDVARITDHVASLCKRLAVSAPAAERMNLMRATVNFYTEVTPVLLESNVPFLPLISKDLVYQVLLSSDALAVHKLLLTLSRYPQQSARVLAMRSDPGLSRVRVKLATATVGRLPHFTTLMEDVLLLLFGRRKGAGGQFRGETAEVRERLAALADGLELELDNHAALLSYQLLAETRSDYQEDAGRHPVLLDLMSADGLVGFTAFQEACGTHGRGRR
ncbi:hypothetical protein FJT64_007851 [Amphibalanus amphitrite]|uniref:Uncharacterized protein n=1 Tax=Amphibalanus amphitrite TaxID=1232801 RepID=A0A6A4VKA4_AMPAM|nr:hypothetical protein FJT64_007851 [Amphibalanus amphitrite]KAF0294486.1 hypothetical protein FJT64_007851 [Amphibalanus amphitrite]